MKYAGFFSILVAITFSLGPFALGETPVYFADSNLKAVVATALGTPDPTPTNMLLLTSLDASGDSIVDLTGLEYATHLKYLYLSNNQISDISPLTGLTSLLVLDLTENPLSEDAYMTCIPAILAHNQGIDISYDPPHSHQCTLMVSTTAHGTVTDPGLGGFGWDSPTVVPLSATADTGSVFVNWTGTAVDAGRVASPDSPNTTVIVDGQYTLQANFRSVTFGFREAWDVATVGVYTPLEGTFIRGDEGYWSLQDALTGCIGCGPTLQRAQVLSLKGDQAPLLTSKNSGGSYSDIVSVVLAESTLYNAGFAIWISANTTISFDEVGVLTGIGQAWAWRSSLVHPSFDNVSLLLTDNYGNVLAYVLQRDPAAVANTPLANLGDSYREVFLDPAAISYQRSLFNDFQTIPAFHPADSEVRSIEFRVDQHGSAIIDNIVIGPQALISKEPVYRFWAPALGRHFFTADQTERQKLIDAGSDAWVPEGVGFFALPDGSESKASPVYRFWSPAMSSHFYTMSEGERNKLLKASSDVWQYEGIAFYAFAEGNQPADATPIYRFWCASLGEHFYTASPAEKDKLLKSRSAAWTLEGIAWYAYASWPFAGTLDSGAYSN